MFLVAVQVFLVAVQVILVAVLVILVAVLVILVAVQVILVEVIVILVEVIVILVEVMVLLIAVLVLVFLKIKRNLDFFELQYLNLHQVEEFQEAFSKGKTDDNYLFHAWLAMKLASKPNKKESFELILLQYRPNLRPATKKVGNNLPEGPNR